MNNSSFSRIAAHVRNSTMPADLKNSLLLIFFRMSEPEQARILTSIEKNPETLHLFAEFLTELEQGNINLNDKDAIAALLEKYLNKGK